MKTNIQKPASQHTQRHVEKNESKSKNLASQLSSGWRHGRSLEMIKKNSANGGVASVRHHRVATILVVHYRSNAFNGQGGFGVVTPPTQNSEYSEFCRSRSVCNLKKKKRLKAEKHMGCAVKKAKLVKQTRRTLYVPNCMSSCISKITTPT